MSYLTRKQLLSKFPYISESMLKNILVKNIGGFREKVVRRIGRRLLFNQEEFLKYIEESR